MKSPILIAHRGNINGKCTDKENEPSYIIEALEKKYQVEVDVHLINNKWYLGHDQPQYLIKFEFLKKNGLWCHAKNIESLNAMIEENIHCFWHQNDDYTLTSRGYVWAYPGIAINEKTICLMPEITEQDPKGSYGICSDFIERYQFL